MNMLPTYIELPSKQMQMIYTKIKQVVNSNIPFLITGDTGVGKEGIAKYIYENSQRKEKPFVAINCGRYSTELLQSELFGHEAGAFTSAIRQRQGAFELANGGILFLDEVPEMSMDAQKMLLRVLDTSKFTRLGGNQILTVDVHILTATNRDIEKEVAEKHFREDLYYRLTGMRIHIPPLRERTEDISPLIDAFINEFSAEYDKDVSGITIEALKRLKQAAWKGNIRQLRSTIQTAIALTTTEKLELKDFPNIYPDYLQTLITLWGELSNETQHAIWDALHPEMQHIIMHEFSTQLPQPWYSVRNSIGNQSDVHSESIDIQNMNQNQILCEVANLRIDNHPSLREAAKSLEIDIRTLQRYAHWKRNSN